LTNAWNWLTADSDGDGDSNTEELLEVIMTIINIFDLF
jgi:hypothetical protein